MKFHNQKIQLPILNLDSTCQENQFRKHSGLFGLGCKRGLIVGPSGCGKTNAMISLLLHPNGLRFENIYLYSKSLHQPKYRTLSEILKPMKEIGYYEYDNDKDIISPQEVKPNSILIFDDIVCSNQSIIRDYFTFGRHNNIDCFYLCQTYTKIPKQLIRDNANLMIVFEQDGANLKHIYNEFVQSDMSQQQFRDICSQCWKNKYDFLVIDKEFGINSGRYRKGYDCFISI
jgi:hypothetical protein